MCTKQMFNAFEHFIMHSRITAVIHADLKTSVFIPYSNMRVSTGIHASKCRYRLLSTFIPSLHF
jgi:hypothetical protein